jgi:hypothetical protein
MDLQEKLEIASKFLNISVEQLSVIDIEGIEGGTYIVVPNRGGSVIVADDGSVLYAYSAMNPIDHIKAFNNGTRT